MEVPRAKSGSKGIARDGVTSMVTVCAEVVAGNATANSARKIIPPTNLTIMAALPHSSGVVSIAPGAPYYIVLMLDNCSVFLIARRPVTFGAAIHLVIGDPYANFLAYRIFGCHSGSARYLRRHHGHAQDGLDQ